MHPLHLPDAVGVRLRCGGATAEASASSGREAAAAAAAAAAAEAGAAAEGPEAQQAKTVNRCGSNTGAATNRTLLLRARAGGGEFRVHTMITPFILFCFVWCRTSQVIGQCWSVFEALYRTCLCAALNTLETNW